MLTVITGFGQFHTNKPGSNKSKPYKEIGWLEIQSIVDKPKVAPKHRCQWIIPSSFHSRNFEEQSKNGSYWLLCADLDDHPKQISYVKDTLVEMLGSDFEIYTTSSATRENQKARILIPLANALSPEEWMLSQQTLNKLLCQRGITPDRVNERFGQIYYLPNKGEYYQSISIRDGNYFNPLNAWHGLSTECTDEYRGLQKNTEITEDIASTMDYSKLPSDCCPMEEGQRNKCLFIFARYLKKLYPEVEFEFLRPLVVGWHKHFIDVIGTKNFSETWADFRRGWRDAKVPYGQGIVEIIDSIDFDIAIPQSLIDLGYGAKEFELLLICRQLQLINGEDPFFLSVRNAGKFINYHYTGAAKMLNSLLADGFLELVTNATMVKAIRYKCLWNG